MNHSAVFFLAILLHDSVRASVEAGDTLAHAVDPAKARPFVEWPDLPERVRHGRRLTAANLLRRYVMGEILFDLGGPETVDGLAAAIHEAERDAVEQGLVMIKLDRPWVDFAELPEPAQAGRRRQAAFLLARMFIVAGRAHEG